MRDDSAEPEMAHNLKVHLFFISYHVHYELLQFVYVFEFDFSYVSVFLHIAQGQVSPMVASCTSCNCTFQCALKSKSAH